MIHKNRFCSDKWEQGKDQDPGLDPDHDQWRDPDKKKPPAEAELDDRIDQEYSIMLLNHSPSFSIYSLSDDSWAARSPLSSFWMNFIFFFSCLCLYFFFWRLRCRFYVSNSAYFIFSSRFRANSYLIFSSLSACYCLHFKYRSFSRCRR